MPELLHAETQPADKAAPLSREQEELLPAPQAIGAYTRTIRLTCALWGMVDSEAVAAALDRLVERHEMLRTVFESSPEGLRQRVLSHGACDFAEHDLRQAESESLAERMRRDAALPFDLRTGKPLRARLYFMDGSGSILVLCAPEIALDYPSLRSLAGEFEVVFGELSGCASLRNGRQRPLPQLQATYLDYARRQNNSHAPALHVAASRTGAAGEAPPLNLPFDRRPDLNAPAEPAEFRFDVDAELTRRLTLFAVATGHETSTAFLAAFAVLLSRYSGAEAVPVSVLSAGARSREFDNVAGNFSSASMVILDCPPQMPLAEFLANVANAAPPDGLAPGNPASTAVFAWEKRDCRLTLCSGVAFEMSEIESIWTETALGLRIVEQGSRIRASLIYRSDLCEEAVAEQMSRHLLRLLTTLSALPQSIGALEMMSEPEEMLMRELGTGPSAEYPDKCLHELFALHAIARPWAEAVVYGKERLSYQELDRFSDRLARLLLKGGLRPEEPVCICMEPGADMVIAIVGILKAGGCYAPVDPKYPAERIAFMLSDMVPRWTVANQSTESELRRSGSQAPHTQFIYAEELRNVDSGKPDAPVRDRAVPGSVAALIYTSGSTGNPKGTLIPHRAVVRAVTDRSYLNVTPADRIGQVTSPSFDVCILEVWSALANGAALVGISRQDMLDTSTMGRILGDERVSVLCLPSAYLSQIGHQAPAILKGLGTVLFGGEAADAEAVRRILQAGPPKRLINAYGTTETGIMASFHEITQVDEDAATIPIGRPVSNIQIYLLDSGMKPVPLGVTGEIYVGGDIGLGYWRRPSLSEEKFVPDFMSGKAGARLYRTGDRARLCADGNLEFAGRMDRQAKIRGYRIELDAVQQVFAAHPSVRQAYVGVREDHTGYKRLVAWVVLRGEPAFAAQVLRTHAQQMLPDFMVPAAILPVDSFPLTRHGKVNAAALPDPVVRPDTVTRFVAPETDFERAIAELWQKILSVESVGREDDFFELGGDSLLGMRLMVSIRDTFGLEVSLRSLFETGRLGDFCASIRPALREPGRPQALVASAGDSEHMPAASATRI